MTKEDVLKMFFSFTYENQINELVLNDIDYVVDDYGVLNYVATIIDVPYSDYLDYIKAHPISSQIESKNITQSSSFEACEREMIKIFLSEDNRGLDYVSIGRNLGKYLRKHNDIAFRKYGENQVKTAKQLGIAFEYFNQWYLNCIGYVYNEISDNDKTSLLARNIIRDPLYNKIIRDILVKDVDILSYMDCIPSLETKYRRYDSVKALVEICLSECDNESISHYRILNTKQILKSAIQSKTKKENNSTQVLLQNATYSTVAEENYSLEYYLDKFANLRCYKKEGKKAPYKALMLLSVFNLIEIGIIRENRIEASEELKDEYVKLGSLLNYDKSLFTPTFDNPFIHLAGDGFWHIKRKNNLYNDMKGHITSINEIEYVHLDEELYKFVKDDIKRMQLKYALLRFFTLS